MSTLYLLNKPFNHLSSFTDPEGRATLASLIDVPNIYAAGRLDYDSEGLLILTDDGSVQHRLANPKFKLPKTYWVQVEGIPDEQALKQLQTGVLLNDGMTKPAGAERMDEPSLWTRTPPIRERKNQPTSWLKLTLSEGKNRQVRRMTAAVGHPTLRLVRWSIGEWALDTLEPGEWRKVEIHLPKQVSKQRSKDRRSNASRPRGR